MRRGLSRSERRDGLPKFCAFPCGDPCGERLRQPLAPPRRPLAEAPGHVAPVSREALHRWLGLCFSGVKPALAREMAVDIYHAHDLNTLPVAAKAARRDRAQLIYDSHELFPERQVIGRAERPIWAQSSGA